MAKSPTYGEIAIIGEAFQLPAGLSTREQLWQFLLERRDAVVEVPARRWSIHRFYDPADSTPGKTSMRYGSFLGEKENGDDFEPLFFGISPREGMTMDYQQRLLLETAWHVMEDAALIPAELSGSRTGVFVGGFTQDHMIYCGSPFMRAQITDQFAATAAPMTMLAARLAHVFGFQGPAMALDTACSSSLVAIHQACNSLRLGECDMALAGGVNFMSYPLASITMTKGHFLARDGRSKSFDASADGYGRGEGCVLFALKRLDNALRDGNDIRGVICGSGVNQDGRTAVLTMPSAEAQEALIRETAQRAGVALSDIAYVEAHGTGTPVGDPIEARAISQAIGCNRPEGQKVVIGAVKANLGHTEAVAGALGVLKALLCLNKQAVPPQANLTTPNPAIPFEEYRLELPQEKPVSLTGREAADGHLYAVVNSFGYGGTNGVALLRRPTRIERESAQRFLRRNRVKDMPKGVTPVGFLRRTPLMVSAFTAASLRKLGESYATLLATDPPPDWRSVCGAALTCRTRFRHRALIVPSHTSGEEVMAEARAALQALAAGESHPALSVGEAVTDRPVRPVFLFSGMGPQWWGMGRYLIRKAPMPVRRLAQEIDALFHQQAGWSICAALLQPEKISRVQETVVAQPGLFLVQVCLARFFALHGVMPGAVVGHSLGEVAAAHVAGALSLEDAVKVVFHRSRLQARLEGRGGMLAVGLGEDALSERLAPYGDVVSVAAVNAPGSSTLAGERTALEQISAACETEGVFSRFLRTTVPYHSPLMDEIGAEMQTALPDIAPRVPSVPLYSTVTGARWAEDARHDGAYWQQNARQPVRFMEAVRQLLADDHAVFLELSAHPVLGSSVRETAEETRHSVALCPTLRRGADEARSLIMALTSLSLSGAEPDWHYILPRARVSLPFYPWHEGGQLSQETEAGRRDRLDCSVHPVLGTPSLQVGKMWQADITATAMPWLADHRIDGVTLFPAAGYVEAALAAHWQMEGKTPAVLENLSLTTPLVLQEGVAPGMAWVFDPVTHILSFSSETAPWRGDWQKHGQVSILQASPWVDERVDVSALCSGRTRFAGDAVYDELARYGLEYGSSFRTLRALYRGDDGAVGEVALAPAEAAVVEDYLLHPALLDGALHAMIGAFPLDDRAGDDGGIFVPVSFRRLSYLGQKTTELFVHVTLSRFAPVKVEADLRLYAPDGGLVAEVLGLCCRRLARAGHDGSRTVQRLLHAPEWLATERHMLMSEPLSLALLGTGGDIASRLMPLLESNGVTLQHYPALDDEALPSFLRDDAALVEMRAVVLLCPLVDEGGSAELVRAALRLVNAIPVRTRRKRVPLVVVTRSAQRIRGQTEEVCPDQRAVVGFFRGVQSERADLHVRCVDVPVHVPNVMLEDIAAELVLEGSQDDTVALRVEQRLVQRLVVLSLEPEPDPEPLAVLQERASGPLGVRLTPGPSHTVEGLYWQAYDVPEPGPGEITLRTLAAGINFKDILKAMNLLPEAVVDGTYNGTHMGMEAVAEVVAVGEGVTSRTLGERLVVLHPDSFASHRVVAVDVLESQRVIRTVTPDIAALGIDHLAGATLVFVTAYYCLVHLACLKAGETVLVHAGAGGVGLAAIQVARACGATVYATAGTDEKRAYLLQQGCAGVWDSRSLEFVDGIRAVTDGRGVDVVLNSLTGEALEHSFELVASRGRFVEIGKRDMIEHSRLDLSLFNRNVAFFAFDMDRLMPYNWTYAVFEEILTLADQGKLRLLSSTIFKAADAMQAFRFMASSRHIGKVVLSFEDMSDLQARPVQKKVPKVSAQGAYLITGGFGGLGLTMAELLLRQGAGVVHLLGRRLPVADDRKEALKRLHTLAETLGATVETHQVDVTDRQALLTVLDSIKSGEKTLRGVFHAAGVLEDALLSGLTDDSMARVMAPKVIGAAVLDDATQGIDLDYFVLFSSFTTEIGNVGQSAYLAANAWLEGLAERRRQQGQAALAVGWGAIGDVGMLSGNEVAERMFEAAGVRTMTAEDALTLLPILLKTGQPCISVVDIDWSRAFARMGALAEQARFSHLRQNIRKDGLSDTLQLLFDMPEAERLIYVLTRLKQQLGAVLQIAPDSIGDTARLSELGIDSLAAVELQVAIRSEFGVDVSLVLLARNETIIEMARSLLRQAMTMQGTGQAALVQDMTGPIG